MIKGKVSVMKPHCGVVWLSVTVLAGIVDGW